MRMFSGMEQADEDIFDLGVPGVKFSSGAMDALLELDPGEAAGLVRIIAEISGPDPTSEQLGKAMR
mgnify:CR=1 FL=1